MAKRVFSESYGAGSSKGEAISSSGRVLRGLPQVETNYPAPSDKVCIVCSFSIDAEYLYGIFIVDLKSTEGENKVNPLEALKPSIVLDYSFPEGMAFGFWRKKLFMFGGVFFDMTKKRSVPQSSVFAIDIVPESISQMATHITLSKDKLEELPSMRGSKKNPIAVIVGDKFCVFPRLITNPKIETFELFHPLFQHWTTLPQFPEVKSYNSKGVWVEAYCVQETNLLISTAKNIYLINLERWTKFVWISLVVELIYNSVQPRSVAPPSAAPARSVGFLFSGRSLMLEDLCFSPLVVLFMQPYMGVPVPLSFFPPHGEQRQIDPLVYYMRGLEKLPVRGDSSVVCLGERRICTAKVGFADIEEEEEGLRLSPCLLLEAFNFKSLSSGQKKNQKACHFNFGFGCHIESQDEYAEQLEITALTSSKYELTDYICDGVGINGFFAM